MKKIEMGQIMVKTEEHAFKAFAKMQKEKDYPNVILLYGREQFLIDWAYEELLGTFIEPTSKTLDLSVFFGEKIDMNAVAAAIRTFPVLSKRKVVVLQGFNVLKADGNKLKPADEEILISAVSEIPQDAMLIITASEADKRKKLYKTIEKNGRVFDFSALSENDFHSFIVKHFANYGKKIEIAAVIKFIQNCGYLNKESEYTLYNAENDIRKISAYSEGKSVIASDVMEFVSENLEANIFIMLDYLSHADVGKALLLLNSIMEKGTNEYQIIALLSSQFELMVKIIEMKEEGKSLSVIANSLKVHEYRVKKANEFIGTYSKKAIVTGLMFIYNMDRAVKEGTMEARLLLELFISMGSAFKQN